MEPAPILEVEGERAQESAPAVRPFPLLPFLGLSVAMVGYCVALYFVLDQPHDGGFGWGVAWEYGQWIGTILGFLLLLQGFFKLTNPLPYFEEVDAFQMPLPGWIIGVFFIILELFTGPVMFMGTLSGDYSLLSQLATYGSFVDIAGYVTLSLTAFLRNYAFSWKFECPREDKACVKNCTCFGIYGAQKLTVWVLLQDVIVVAETVAHFLRFTRYMASMKDGTAE